MMGTPNDPRTLHNYAYAFNNPVNLVDPSGLMPFFGPVNASYQGGTPLDQPLGYAPTPPTQGGSGYAHLAGSRPPERSVNGSNGGGWKTRSDPQPRQQSQGFRPRLCGVAALLVGIRDLGQAAIDTTRQIDRELREDWINHYKTCQGIQCSVPYRPQSRTLNKLGQAVAEFARENPVLVHNASCEWNPYTSRWHEPGNKQFITFDEARNRVELPGEG